MANKDEMRRVGTFVSEFDSHGIYGYEGVIEDAKTQGVPLEWLRGSFTIEDARAEIARRGVGGHCHGDPGAKVIGGCDMARDAAMHYLGSAPGDRFFGRGSAFRANVAALM